MIPTTLTNPFEKRQVGREVTPPPGNVPDLYKGVLGRCRQAMQDTEKTRSGTTLLIRGEAGSGKSHLITQLRHDLADKPNVVVLLVHLRQAYLGQVWRYLRSELMGDLIRTRWHPNDLKLMGLTRVAKNAFPTWKEEGTPKTLGVFGGSTGAQDLDALLGDYPQELSYEFRKVLPQVWDPALRTVATSWLAGKMLGEDDLKKLGLPPTYPNDYEQEQIARDVVMSICRLAGKTTTLVICFDEIEALLTGTNDAAALRALTTLVTDLSAEPGPRVLATFVRPGTIELLRKHVEHSNLQKMSQLEIEIPPITWEQSVQIVLARLHSDPGCKAERAGHAVEQFWPFGEKFLRDFVHREGHALTPRHLIVACQAEFDRLRSPTPTPSPAAPVVPPPPAIASSPPPPPPPPPDLREVILKAWQDRRQQHAKKPASLTFSTVLGKGLPWLAGARAVPFEQISEIEKVLGDMNIVFRPTEPGSGPIGVSFCDQDAAKLWPRLDRLIRLQEAKAHGKLGRVVVVRRLADPLSDKARQRLDKLTALGVTVYLMPDEVYLDLATFQDFTSKVQTGQVIDYFGKPVSVEEYLKWAKSAVTPALDQLASVVFGGKPQPVPAGVTRPAAVSSPSPPAPPPALAKTKPAKTSAAKK